MCLDITGSRVRYLIAKKDIIVYKILVNNDRSPYKNFLYRANKEYTSVRLKARKVDCNWNWQFKEVPAWEINEGLHAYRTLAVAREMLDENEKIVLFTIPAGTRYVYGDNDEVVAEKMLTGSLKGIK